MAPLINHPMATFEEIAELTSDINQKLDTHLTPDNLTYLIEEFIEDEEVPFTEVPISELEPQVYDLLLLADAVIIAQDGEPIEVIEKEVADTSARLSLEV